MTVSVRLMHLLPTILELISNYCHNSYVGWLTNQLCWLVYGV